MRKNAIFSSVFYLKKREYLTPNFVRITLQGTPEEIAELIECTPGVNNKIFIPPAGVDEVFFPEFDFQTGRWKFQNEATKPYIRTYTHRGINTAQSELIIDFVAHGSEGPASHWATEAPIGAPLGVSMATGASSLCPEAQWYLLAGDATALPVLSALMEQLPDSACGKAFIEVMSAEDIQTLQHPKGINITWIINAHPEQSSDLAKHVIEETIPADQSTFAYVASEFSTVKTIRTHFRNVYGWNKDKYYAYSYWKSGANEELSDAERREEAQLEMAKN